MRRVTLIAAAVAAFFLATYGLCVAFGWLTPEWTRNLLTNIPPGATAAAVFGLLASDLLLPVPSSVVLSAAGMALGWLPAALAGCGGMLAGNLAGYWLCRLAGRRAFERLVKADEAAEFGRWLDRWGPAALVISRLVPVMAETLSCLAGAARMSFGRFLGALCLGTVPYAVFFAVLGEKLGRVLERPGWVLLISLAIPAAGWLVFSFLAGTEEKT